MARYVCIGFEYTLVLIKPSLPLLYCLVVTQTVRPISF